jgi:hypothetical protein
VSIEVRVSSASMSLTFILLSARSLYGDEPHTLLSEAHQADGCDGIIKRLPRWDRG